MGAKLRHVLVLVFAILAFGIYCEEKSGYYC